MWSRFKTLDPLLYVIPMVLMVISVAVIYALTADNAGSSIYLRQAIASGLGIIMMAVMTFIDYRGLKAWWLWLYLGGIILLLLVPVLGVKEFGAQSWIKLGGTQFQPGELMKLVVIIALAAILGQNGKLAWTRYFAVLAMACLSMLLIVKQPDFGTALIIFVITVGVILHANLKKSQRIIIMIGAAVAIASISLSFQSVPPFNNILKPYQKDRLASFVDPSRDQSGTGYNVLQSVIAVGSGGLTGKGLGQGSQSQLNFLPVPHADFIFAVIAEAWGLVGVVAIISLLSLLITRIMKAASLAKDQFGALICVGIVIKLMLEMLVNIGMNIRVMPVTGIPLPFLSYGGTNMLTNALAIGIIQSIVIRYKRLTF